MLYKTKPYDCRNLCIIFRYESGYACEKRKKKKKQENDRENHYRDQ